MRAITANNINSKFDFFKRVCIEECIRHLAGSIPDNTTVTILKNNIDDNTADDYGGALCEISYSNDKIRSHIFISEDVMEFNKIHYPEEKERWENFLKSLEVPVNRYSLFLIILLHEFGHANLVKLFHDAGVADDYTIFDSLSDSITDIFGRRRQTLARWETFHNDINLPQLVNGVEAQCDIFARDNFLPLWKRINDILDKYTIGGGSK